VTAQKKLSHPVTLRHRTSPSRSAPVSKNLREKSLVLINLRGSFINKSAGKLAVAPWSAIRRETAAWLWGLHLLFGDGGGRSRRAPSTKDQPHVSAFCLSACL
jgi:hypothetical protein